MVKSSLTVCLIACLGSALYPASQDLHGGSGTNIDNYCAEFTQDMVDNLRTIHGAWNTGWNKYRVTTFGNSITDQNSHWLPLDGNVTGISNAAAINTFKDSTFDQSTWIANGKMCQSGQTIKWVANNVGPALSAQHPMIAAIMIGTNNIQQNHSTDGCADPVVNVGALDCYPDTLEYRLITSQLITAGVIPIITTIPPIDYDDPSWPRENRKAKELTYVNKLKVFAQTNNLPMIDLHQWCEDHGGAAPLLADWAHPISCSDGNASLSDNCLDGGVSGGVQNARHYMLIMAINDIVRYVIDGENPTADVTAPAAVSDLAASPGAYSGTVDLSWTATGDDSATGIAYEYDLRYSTDAITEGNFSSATQITGVPSPQSPGTSQSMTVLGLTPGTAYYFALKASDRYNWSALSSVPQAVATTGTAQDDSMRVEIVKDTYLESVDPTIKGANQFVRLKSWNQGVMMFGFNMSGVTFVPDSACICLKMSTWSSATNYTFTSMARAITVAWDENSVWTGATNNLSGNIGSGVEATSLNYNGPRTDFTEYRFPIAFSVIQAYATGAATGIALYDQGSSGVNNDFFSREKGGADVPYMMVYIKASTATQGQVKGFVLSDKQLSVSPNPFRTSVQISVSGVDQLPASLFSVRIYDMCGALISALAAGNKALAQGISWNASRLTAGVYVVQVRANGKVLSKKISLVK
ncbi:MAG: hypothetical protein A2268_08680 [Candidatus Raymondbacteria bacterium RifOxyA12_full_50_37]|uniref:Fibronectin type-III domain-containing protein n=1 Tax=Candidatus Raymondbacteria bacterium RIFOXYD12_FULL_49_13 TaxID=1817890 RepID=A0A1F7FLX7_UNCRA|nr:MAG: hypothetical protein A2268_08680 [Candidatus Raymondbacteria bacterium RifOxyA12_full_50_37]OGJ93323.1 MAG: hypothetical protein A2248_07910 [Candidatus Raymondbacteria bacterium RIFOXYA2_FULL_49_16]OGJ95207.1 MAG: hypothetical protein A2453_12060 [Candidatus Raymondbacteria bacterium RIFOXYC2_FULL_50_21]OGK06911.1 MAG: hypothetical protein A2487_14465 [Candidatus Raymondbacteria bacterium RifOxyC12_full_50_8]OGK07506.1 MAG: hypothetical protein A2519_16735 [Candidatus Raymondbacteria b